MAVWGVRFASKPPDILDPLSPNFVHLFLGQETRGEEIVPMIELGGGPRWLFWRQCLENFLPLLFRAR